MLVADSDASSLQFLEKFLVLSGYRVRCATGGHEALQAFFETAPQLVIVDATLPEISGLEFCRRLRQTAAGRHAYIIMLTLGGDEGDLVRLFDAGADDFITKPFSARPLFARIRASLRVVGLQERVSQDRDEIQRIHAELAVAHRRLEQDALTDVLTGLPNRRYLIDRLAHDWAAARRGGTPLACMMVDIDRFKSVNDTWGHDVGDCRPAIGCRRAAAGSARHGRRLPLRRGGVRRHQRGGLRLGDAVRRTPAGRHRAAGDRRGEPDSKSGDGEHRRRRPKRTDAQPGRSAQGGRRSPVSAQSGRDATGSPARGTECSWRPAPPADDGAPPALAEALLNTQTLTRWLPRGRVGHWNSVQVLPIMASHALPESVPGRTAARHADRNAGPRQPGRDGIRPAARGRRAPQADGDAGRDERGGRRRCMPRTSGR